MSYLPPSQTGYYDAIQVFFTEATGRVALFNARDQELLSRWNQEGRSAQLICRGIREAVLAMREESPPRSLRDCERYIDQEWEASKERTVGVSPGSSLGRNVRRMEHQGGKSLRSAVPGSDSSVSDSTKSADSLSDGVAAALQEGGKKEAAEHLKEAYRLVWKEMRLLQERGRSLQIEDVEYLDRLLVEHFFGRLEEDEQKEIDRSIDAASQGLLRAMSPRAREEHMLARRKKWLKENRSLLDLVEKVLFS